MAYIFKKTPDNNNKFDNTEVTINTTHNELSLDDLMEIFTEFIKACGYSIPNDSELILIRDNEDER